MDVNFPGSGQSRVQPRSAASILDPDNLESLTARWRGLSYLFLFAFTSPIVLRRSNESCDLIRWLRTIHPAPCGPVGASQLQFGSHVFPANTFHGARPSAGHVLSRHAQGLAFARRSSWSFVRRCGNNHGSVVDPVRLGFGPDTAKCFRPPAKKLGLEVTSPDQVQVLTASVKAYSLAPSVLGLSCACPYG